MIDEEAMKRIYELSDLYEYRWGKEPDILAMPSTIDQRQLADVLERIVDTGESVMVGYQKLLEKANNTGNEDNINR